MGIDFNRGLGLEGLQRGMLVQLSSKLDEQLVKVDEYWKPLDEQLAEALKQEYVDSACEPIAVFADGHRPSFINAPIEQYPNVSVMAYKAIPSAEQYDQGNVYDDTVFVETIVKSQTFQEEEELALERTKAETIVNRRIQRTADAIQRVVESDITLGGSVFALKDPPSVDISDAFIRKESVGSGGDKWLWQLARLEWRASKYSDF